MTEEEKARKVSAIKRINERLAAIGREFGKDSELYQRFKNAITLSIPEDARTGSGTISRSTKTLDKISEQVITDLLKHHTVGQIKKTAREQIAREKGKPIKQVTSKEVSQYIDIMDKVTKYLSKLTKEESGFYQPYWDKNKGGPRPSYTILKAMMDTTEEAKELRSMGKEEEAALVEDKLTKRRESEARDIEEVYFS